MTVIAGIPDAFRRQQPAYDWNDLASVIALTGDANHNHIPGSPMEWRHTYIPVSEAAARSHGHGKVPKDWKAPAGGSGKGVLTGPHPADKLTGAANPATIAKGMSGGDLKAADKELSRRAALLGKPGQMSKGHKAVAAEIASRSAPGKVTQGDLTKIRKQTGLDMGHPDAFRLGAAKPDYAEALGHLAAGRNDEAVAAMDRMVAHAQAMKGPEGKRTVAAAVSMRDKVRGAVKPKAAAPPKFAGATSSQPGMSATDLRALAKRQQAAGDPRWTETVHKANELEGKPQWRKDMEAQAAKSRAAGIASGRAMDRNHALHSAQAMRMREATGGITFPHPSDLGGHPGDNGAWQASDLFAKGDLTGAAAALDRQAAGETSKARAARNTKLATQLRAVTLKPTLPALAKVPGTQQPDKSFTALDHNGTEHTVKLEGTPKRGTVTVTSAAGTRSMPAIDDPTQAARILAGNLAGTNKVYGTSKRGKPVMQGDTVIVPDRSAAKWSTTATPGGRGVVYGVTGGNKVLVATGDHRAYITASPGEVVHAGPTPVQSHANEGGGTPVTWSDLDSAIDLAASSPVKTASVKAPARPPGKPATVPPVPPPVPARRSKITPLTPMRVQAAKSMTKLADSMKETHPEMLSHQHVRDAARMLRAGNEEAAQRHLRAAMFSLTPQSLMRHGIHTDDAHTAARGHMHGAHRALLLVKDITDVAAKNQAAVARASYGDNLSAPPHPDPNNGFGPGALAQKPTVRQPPGNQALNAPAKVPSGGSDPAVADPDSPQKPGSKQFSYGWDDLGTLVELSAETGRLAVTPAPRGKPGGPGLYDVKGQEHTPYFQNLVKALIEKRGMDPGKAYAIAYGALRKWAKGGGKVHGEVRAAAAGALAGEAAKAHGHAVTWDDVALTARHVIELAAGQTRVPAGQPGGGQWAAAQQQQAVAGHQAGATASQKHMAHIAHLRHLVAIGTATPAQKTELAGLMKTLGPAVKAPAVKAPAKPKAAAKAPAAPKAAAKPKAAPKAAAAPKPKAAAKAPAAPKAAAKPKAVKAAAAPKAAAKAPAATAAAPATASGSSSGSGSGSQATPASSSAGTPATAPSATGTPPAASSATAPPTTTGTPPTGTPATTTAPAATGTPAAASTPAATPAGAAGAPAATTGTPATTPATPAAAIAAAVQQAKTGTPPAGRPAAAPMSAAPVFSKNGTVTVTVGGKPMTMSTQQWKQLRRAQLQAAGPNVRH